jgi:heme exporter protein A
MRLIAGNLSAERGGETVFSGVSFMLGAGELLVVTGPNLLGVQNALKPALTLLENLTFWRKFSGSHAKTVEDALTAVGLPGLGDTPYAYLSTGQKRRAAIARLLVSHRPVWLLDEPTSGLDKSGEAMFAGLLRAHLNSGGIAVAATHLELGVAGAKELRMEVR